MSYIKSTSSANETVIGDYRRSKWSLLGPAIISAVLAPIFGLGIFIFILFYINYKTTEFGITDRRVVSKRGWIKRDVDELMLVKIEGVDIQQGFQARLLGYGDLVFSGTGSQMVKFQMVANPIKVKQEIENYLASK